MCAYADGGGVGVWVGVEEGAGEEDKVLEREPCTMSGSRTWWSLKAR